ncbi:putative phage replication protein [Escherichia coli]|nr:putative phage replication protein [Escherichia coli]
METVFDALKAMGKASSQEVAARLGMTRDEAINELWKLKRRGWADNKGPMWWLTNEKSDENDSVTQAPKVTAQMLIEFIGQEGAKTCEELAGKFGVSTRKVASTLAVVTATGRLARVNQNGKFRYCMPGDNLPAEPKAASVAETDGQVCRQCMDRCRAGETWPPDLAEFVALISESGANPFGLTVDNVMEEYRRWRNESWRYDGSDKYPWSQPVLYHICLEMRAKGIERQMTEGELKRLAERQLAKWAKHVGDGFSVPPVRRQLVAPKRPSGPTPIELLKQEYERRKAAGFV